MLQYLCKEGGDILDSPVFASTVPVHSTLAANQSYGRPVEPRDEQHAVPIGECASVSSLERLEIRKMEIAFRKKSSLLLYRCA